MGFSSETERQALIRHGLGTFSAASRGPAALRIEPSLRGYSDDGSRLDGRERGVDFFHERREVLTGIAPRPKQDDREAEPGDALLVRDTLVRAHQPVELVLGQAGELAASYAPAAANLMLSAMRGVLKACFRLGYMSADDLQRAADVPPARGSRLPPTAPSTAASSTPSSVYATKISRRREGRGTPRSSRCSMPAA